MRGGRIEDAVSFRRERRCPGSQSYAQERSLHRLCCWLRIRCLCCWQGRLGKAQWTVRTRMFAHCSFPSPDSDAGSDSPTASSRDFLRPPLVSSTRTSRSDRVLSPTPVRRSRRTVRDCRALGRSLTSSCLIADSGYLLNGNKFDSSYDRGQPLPFNVGVGQVIKGWDEGLLSMKVGGKRILLIPSELAYGKRNVANGLIPPNSVT